jgi:hypothetical protein
MPCAQFSTSLILLLRQSFNSVCAEVFLFYSFLCPDLVVGHWLHSLRSNWCASVGGQRERYLQLGSIYVLGTNFKRNPGVWVWRLWHYNFVLKRAGWQLFMLTFDTCLFLAIWFVSVMEWMRWHKYVGGYLSSDFVCFCREICCNIIVSMNREGTSPRLYDAFHLLPSTVGWLITNWWVKGKVTLKCVDRYIDAN